MKCSMHELICCIAMQLVYSTSALCVLCVWKQADLPRIDSLIFISFQ